MSVVSRHYVLAAGGTGGHLIPAFALATELERRGHHVALITDARGSAIPGKPATLPAHVLPAGRFQGKNPLSWIKGVQAIMEGRSMALRLFESFEPSAVIGFGGYPALPALLAATSAKIPTVIHEQNAVLGRVNRFLAGRVDAIATAYREVDRLSSKHAGKVHLVGNPVRDEVLALRNKPFPAFTADGLLRVLVTGGSQGARVMADIVPGAIERLEPSLWNRLVLTQQVREEDMARVRALYDRLKIRCELAPFFADLPAKLASHHLVVSRSGAGTVAELAAIGRPSILVPLPGSIDQDQFANAGVLSQVGGALRIPQSEFTSDRLASEISALVAEPSKLTAMGKAAHSVGRLDAAERMADLVMKVAGI
jgi:UDP-N-acetylglucosamine--N-acetylmuramyl-(pentapeptide) pyrophosphoryl-undecaprenol N-acetylglucosamine transferase